MQPFEIAGNGAGRLEILCIGAHPDDIEIGCGGTVLKLAEENPGTIVHWLVTTGDGERKEEAKRGADRFRPEVAGGEVLLWDFPDGFLPFQGAEVKRRFESLKGRLNPDLIFTHYRFDRHQDHRLVSDLTWNTWRDHAILEYEIPKWDGDLGQPGAFVALSEAAALEKTEAILTVFASQQEKHWFTRDTFLGLMRLRGNECRAEEHFAEAFFARKLLLF